MLTAAMPHSESLKFSLKTSADHINDVYMPKCIKFPRDWLALKSSWACTQQGGRWLYVSKYTRCNSCDFYTTIRFDPLYAKGQSKSGSIKTLWFKFPVIPPSTTWHILNPHISKEKKKKPTEGRPVSASLVISVPMICALRHVLGSGYPHYKPLWLNCGCNKVIKFHHLFSKQLSER